jgi:hypothetical protein
MALLFTYNEAWRIALDAILFVHRCPDPADTAMEGR